MSSFSEVILASGWFLAPGRHVITYRSRVRFILEGIEGLIVLGSVLCSWPLSKRWLNNWGSRPCERRRTWPGDRLTPPDHSAYTRAIRVAAPPETVWPWIVQFGLGRAGFYSYELFERLVGIPVTNVESIDPAFQSIEEGDEIRLHPTAPGIPVAEVQPPKHICFGADPDSGVAAVTSEPARSWSIYIERAADSSCRLLLRGCIEPLRERSWVKRLAFALEEPIDFVMEQRMLRTVKRLAETSGY